MALRAVSTRAIKMANGERRGKRKAGATEKWKKGGAQKAGGKWMEHGAGTKRGNKAKGDEGKSGGGAKAKKQTHNRQAKNKEKSSSSRSSSNVIAA